MQCIHILRNHSYIKRNEKKIKKRNEVLIHATIWISHDNFILSESPQKQMFTDSMSPFMSHIQNR